MCKGVDAAVSIKVENLVYTYSKDGPFEKRAIDNVSFEIQDGSFIGVIGHTGSGKSTLVQHLNGLIKPDSGHIYINGIDITQKGTDMKKIRSKVGMVFQYPEHQLFEETVYKDIAYGPSNMGFNQNEIKQAVMKACELIDLDSSLMNKSPFELSGGQKRKVAIAGVLAMNPDILILDEPTAALDPRGRRELLGLISRLHKNSRKTIIVVSHSMEDIAEYAQKVMVMSNGRLALFDTVEKVFKEKELLKSIGLGIPEITRIVQKLKAEGVDLGGDYYTVESAYVAIKNYLNNKQN